MPVKGGHVSEETKQKMRKAAMGRIIKPETRLKISLSKKLNAYIPRSAFKKGHIPWNKGLKGFMVKEKNPNWKGGITPEQQRLRNTSRARQWRKDVLKRDNYACVWCGETEAQLHADHIRPWAQYPLVRYEIWNGRTLCIECHKKTRSFGGRLIKSLNPYISMVIPAYTLNSELEEMTIDCAVSYRSQVDELIIVEDGGNPSQLLADIADIYLYNKKNQGFTKAVNMGWRMALGEFVMIVSSDTTLLHNGNLKDLCINDKITSPHIVNQYIDRLAGPFWCAPAEITKKRGMLMEEMRIYSSDSEYDNRVADIFQKIPTVQIYHEQAQTVKAAGVEGAEQQAIDNAIYQKLKQDGKAK